MTSITPVYPETLLTPLFRVDSELLRGRYLEALDAITGRRTSLPVFHIDAMGYSPEVALELEDPYYLGHGASRPYFVVVSLEQLSGPILHPAAGFAVRPFRTMAHDLSSELASLTLSSPVTGELRHGSPRLDDAGRLAALDEVGIAPAITGMRLEDARVLARMSREMMESPTRWCDDTFIAQMIQLAESARGWSRMIENLVERRYPVGSFFHPTLGGSYVFDMGEAGKRSVVVLSATTDASPSDIEGSVRVLLNDENVVDFLTEEELASFDQSHHSLAPTVIENKLFWIGLDFLFQAEGPEGVRGLTPGSIDRRVRKHPSAPEDFLELEEVRFHLSRDGKGLRFSSLSPRTVARLLTPLPSGGGREELTAHLLSFLDPQDWSARFRHAPDLFFGSFPAQHEALRDHIVKFVRP